MRTSGRRRAVAGLAAVAGAWLLCACAAPDDPGTLADGATEPPFIESGDLDAIRARGTVRILVPRLDRSDVLPREGFSADLEKELAASYAKEHGLEPFFVYVDSRDKLIPSLLAGRGDFVAANFTVTDERKRKVDFTVPVATVRERLVARAGDGPFESPQALAGRRIAVRRSTSFWDTVARLRELVPDIEIEEVSESLDTEEIIHRVAMGRYDLTVADSNQLADVLSYRNDVEAAMDLTLDRSIAWAVRPASPGLLQSLNRFLSDHMLTARSAEVHTGDLPAVKERRVLRMLTRNTAASYFLWRGELVGFEYELAREFARQQGLRLEVIVPPSNADLLNWLREGKGDLVAAMLTPTPARRSGGVEFSRPYNFVEQMLVARFDDDTIQTLEDLDGRRVHVRASSAYRDTLQALQNRGIALQIVDAPEELETEEIIARVASGEYDLTLADSHILEIELSWREDIRGVFPVSEEQPLAWAVRASNPELLAAVDAFLQQEVRGLFYNVIYDKYFKNRHRIRSRIAGRVEGGAGLSPWDEVVRPLAEEYGFDWRMIVAQMYEESRFDPEAESFAGARGLMQVLPSTAEEFGVEDLDDPAQSILAGIRYLDWVRERFEDDLPVRDRMWFSLAAYNAGPGHVRMARRLARERGLNANRWFGNVEQTMLLLAQPEVAQHSPYGYCRCKEPVNYVRRIRSRYNAYLDSAVGPDDLRASR